MNTQDQLCRLVMAGSEPIPYAPEIVKAMRNWIADCSWPDLPPEEVAELTEAEVVAGVAKHYAGGVEAFLRTMEGDK